MPAVKACERGAIGVPVYKHHTPKPGYLGFQQDTSLSQSAVPILNSWPSLQIGRPVDAALSPHNLNRI
jgi:hypothetical protein